MKLGFYLFAEYINMFISGAVMARCSLAGIISRGLDRLGLSPNAMAIVRFLCAFCKDHLFRICLYVDPLDTSAVPLRPADEAGMEKPDPAGDIEYGDHRCCNLVKTINDADR